jgi:uncharacterized membrane protein
MQNARFLKHTLICAIILAPIIYLWWMWDTMPASMPMHYDLSGKVDRMGSKQEFLLAILILSGVNLGTYLLISNIHKIDPKRVKAEQSATFNKLAIGVSLFLTALNIIIILSGISNGEGVAQKAILPLVGLLLAFIGNYMNNIKPNYFAGIRVPWTMNDEDNWKQTHRIASHVWVAGGLTIFVASLIAKPAVMEVLMLVLVGIMVIIPVGYSYLLFKRTKSQN